MPNFDFLEKSLGNIYFENLFNDYNTNWTAIYMLPRLYTYVQSFQYKNLKQCPISV